LRTKEVLVRVPLFVFLSVRTTS